MLEYLAMFYHFKRKVVSLLGLFVFATFAIGQTLPMLPAPGKPDVKQDAKPEVKPDTKPEIKPTPLLLPTIPLPPMLPLEPPTMGRVVSGCASCDSCDGVTPGCTDPGCGGKPIIVGPKYPVELDFTQNFFWLQAPASPFPLATSPTNGNVLNGNGQLGMFITPSFNLKMWLDQEHLFGIGGGGFLSESRSRFQTVQGGPSTLERPFFNAVTGVPDSLVVANSVFSGRLATQSKQQIAGADIHFRRNLYTNETCRIDLFAGFRYYDLNESFVIYQATDVTSQTVTVGNQAPLASGQTVFLRDRAYTRNQFYGGEIGTYNYLRHGILFMSVTPRVAFGPFHQVTKIEGETRSTNTTQTTALGGLLAAGRGPNDGNILRSSQNRFGVAANVATQAGINVTEQLSISVGYNFIYFSEVVRPLAQFDSTINTRVVPVSNQFGTISGTAAPRNRNVHDTFYAHGATVTFQISY
jgi:hypothetical protein